MTDNQLIDLRIELGRTRLDAEAARSCAAGR